MNKTIALILVSMLYIPIAGQEVYKVSAKKIRHYPMQYGPFINLSIRDLNQLQNTNPSLSGIPSQLDSIRVFQITIDNTQSIFQDYHNKKISKTELSQYIHELSDTINCTREYINTFISIICGIDTFGKLAYMIDLNCNNDFQDEIIFHPTSLNTHKVYYEKIENRIKILDYTWITLKFDYRNKQNLHYQFNECRQGSVIIDSTEYNFVLYPYLGLELDYDKGYDNKIELYTGTSIDELHRNEIFRLGKTDYIINKISSDGHSFEIERIIKKNDIQSTQIGYQPISFKAITTKGDSINFPKDFKGKYVLLDFWHTGCAPCIEEIKNYYKEIYNRWKGKKFEIIGVAQNSKATLEKFAQENSINWLLIADGETKSILKKYEISYFPTVFLIDDNGIIIAKGDSLGYGRFETILINHGFKQ